MLAGPGLSQTYCEKLKYSYLNYRMKARVLTQLSCYKCLQDQSAWLGPQIAIRDGGERRVIGVKDLESRA